MRAAPAAILIFILIYALMGEGLGLLPEEAPSMIAEKHKIFFFLFVMREDLPLHDETHSNVLSNIAPLAADRNISCNVANLAADTTKQWPYYPRSSYIPTHNSQLNSNSQHPAGSSPALMSCCSKCRQKLDACFGTGHYCCCLLLHLHYTAMLSSLCHLQQ